MIELPEAINIASQLDKTIKGKLITGVTAGQTPHKLAWYYGDKSSYASLLEAKTAGESHGRGALVEIEVEDARILFGDGVNIRFHAKNEARPAKHQLLIEFADGSALSAAVQMYGGMGAFPKGTLDNPYYKAAVEKPSPLSEAFDREHFDSIISDPGVQKMSSKALLATEQRIPGLGNGVLQDILFNAGIHPKKKVNTFSAGDRDRLFDSVKGTLAAMSAQGGRDTEPDIFGTPGGYKTLLSKNTVGKPCPRCGTIIKKEAYMGGSIYYCDQCQSL
jgi:formamidopyrimidine-DNA glycosylase